MVNLRSTENTILQIMKSTKVTNVELCDLSQLDMSCNLEVVATILILISSDNGILLVLVLGNKIDNVLVGLLELHLIHTLTLVPVEERLPLVEGRELLAESLEHV